MEEFEETLFKCLEEAIKIINELTEEYKGGWIPCNERLPENDCEYLVTLRDGEVTTAKYIQEENVWVDTIEEYFEYPCIAWKLLPRPYKEGSE